MDDRYHVLLKDYNDRYQVLLKDYNDRYQVLLKRLQWQIPSITKSIVIF
jgi:hypothetical protein